MDGRFPFLGYPDIPVNIPLAVKVHVPQHISAFIRLGGYASLCTIHAEERIGHPACSRIRRGEQPAGDGSQHPIV